MNDSSARGFALIEAVIAAAVIAIAVAGVAGATGAFARYVTHPDGAVADACGLLAEQTLRVAQDASKYGLADLPSDKTWPTSVSVPVPGSTPQIVSVTVHAQVQAGPSATGIDISVSYRADPVHKDASGTIRLHGDLSVLAPLPGSELVRPGLVPQPAAT